MVSSSGCILPVTRKVLKAVEHFEAVFESEHRAVKRFCGILPGKPPSRRQVQILFSRSREERKQLKCSASLGLHFSSTRFRFLYPRRIYPSEQTLAPLLAPPKSLRHRCRPTAFALLYHLHVPNGVSLTSESNLAMINPPSRLHPKKIPEHQRPLIPPWSISV
jgi:hypothetical protein